MVRNVAIVSLSAGTLGEDFARHELAIGLRRLYDYGLNVKFMPHALNGIQYIRNHPEDRAQDLLQAFRDPDIDMILCAIGGEDTYRLLPYLFESNELQNAVSKKIFLGFSDTTVNHFMLHKVGLPTFYGQSFLSDICELGPEMLPYTRHYFEELIHTGSISEVRPADIWYESRTSYGPDQIGINTKSHPNQGFILLQGSSSFSGQILGGCIDSLYDFFNSDRNKDMPALCQKYSLFPHLDDWEGKILLLETSEEKMSPYKFRNALTYLKKTGIFDVISGILVGKPQDEYNDCEYREELIKVIDNPDLPIVCNINIGHASPRCIIPFGREAIINTYEQEIKFVL